MNAPHADRSTAGAAATAAGAAPALLFFVPLTLTFAPPSAAPAANHSTSDAAQQQSQPQQQPRGPGFTLHFDFATPPHPHPQAQSADGASTQQSQQQSALFLHSLATLFAPLLSAASMGVSEEQYARFMSGGGHKPRIASQSAIDSLPQVRVSEQQVADGLACAVCQCDYEEGEKVLQVGCSHLYHSACLLPWLQSHNSCPTCRFELKTGDAAYDQEIDARQKKRQEEEAKKKEQQTQVQTQTSDDPLQTLASIPLRPLLLPGATNGAAAAADGSTDPPLHITPAATNTDTAVDMCGLSSLRGSPCTLLRSDLSASPIRLACGHSAHPECLHASVRIRTGRPLQLDQQLCSLRCPCCHSATMVHADLLAPQQANQPDGADVAPSHSNQPAMLSDVDVQAMEIDSTTPEPLPSVVAAHGSGSGSASVSGRSSPAWSISDEDDGEMSD